MKYLKNKPKGRSRKQNRAVLLWVLVCLVIVSISSFTLAKYVLQMRDHATAVPTDFFFQSDYLTSEGNEEYEVYSGVIGFKLMNHFIFDQFKRRYYLVGCVGENSEELLQALDNHRQHPGWN